MICLLRRKLFADLVIYSLTLGNVAPCPHAASSATTLQVISAGSWPQTQLFGP